VSGPTTGDAMTRLVEELRVGTAKHELVLHEEEVVTDKRAVPKERVRLDKETVIDEQTVSEQVRKEQIDAEGVEEKKGGRKRRR
jgi:stress response protein YsnF